MFVAAIVFLVAALVVEATTGTPASVPQTSLPAWPMAVVRGKWGRSA